MDAIEEFKGAMRAHGLTPPETIEPGKLHRFPTNGKRGDDGGWCKLFLDGFGGVFGDFRTGLSEHWQAETDCLMTASEREAFRRMVSESMAQSEGERRQRHEAGTQRAAEILEAATRDPATHPYAVKKRVPLGSLVKRGPWPQRGWDDALLVPIYGVDGQVWSIEAINGEPGGDGKFPKDSLKDGKKSGGFHPFGKIRSTGRVLVAEGIANAAVGAEVDQSPAAAALCTSNLKAVALAVRELAAPGADIIILADNDVKPDGSNPGLKAATEAARAAGGRVAIPELDGRECDLWDGWNEHGIEAVRRAIANAKPPDIGEFLVAYRRVSDIQAKPIRWLWPARIARGKVSMLAGHPGLGKSQVTASMAAIVTTGGKWPVDRTPCERGAVIILSAEDDAEDTIRPRLEAVGADLERCYILDAVREHRDDGTLATRTFNLAIDIERLGELAGRVGEVALIAIDPVTAYLGGVDSHKNADVRALLAPLAAMAAERGAAVVCVSHLTKAGGTEAMMRVMGSLGFVAAARGAYLVAKHPEDPDRRLFLPMKNNLAEDRGGLAFRVRGRDLGSGIVTSSVEWDAEPVTMTADEAMASAGETSEDDDDTAKQEAMDWLRDTLKDLLSMDGMRLKDLARQAGISQRTLYRAAHAVGVKMLPGGFGKPRLWHLCPMSAKECHVCQAPKDGTHGSFGTHEAVNEQDGDIIVGCI